MPARMEFEFSSRPQGKPADTASGAGRVRRLLLLGNFCGQACVNRPPLAQRRAQRVDLDNIDSVMARLAPALTLRLGNDTHALVFSQVEDFDADALLLASEPLRRLNLLRQQLKNPASFAQAAAQLMGAGLVTTEPQSRSLADLLGGPIAGPSSPQAVAVNAATSAATPATTSATAPAAGIEAFIRQIVAPHAEPAAPSQQAAFVTATEAALVQSLRAVLHHPQWQALEALWRGVAWLLSSLELDESLELHLLDVTREEMMLDVVQAGGQTAAMQLTQVLDANGNGNSTGNGNGNGTAGHWTALLSLLAFNDSDQDLGLLAAWGRLAQAANAPFVADAGPELVAALLHQATPASAPTSGPGMNLASWLTLRHSEVAPWLGLAAPRLLMRTPYGRGGQRVADLDFEETDSASAHESYLWGPAALAFAWAWVQPPGSNTVDGLPGWSVRRDGETEQLPCAERWLRESDWQALLQGGLMPLVSHAGRHAVQLPRLQSLALPAQALGGA